MLIPPDYAHSPYIIAITNSTGWAELAADFTFLADLPAGEILFDFTHLSGNLTSEKRVDYRPGSFGFHPTDRLAEEVACISHFREQLILWPPRWRARLPSRATKVGAFLWSMRAERVLQKMWLEVEMMRVSETGQDDADRRTLIPLTDILLHGGTPDFHQLKTLRQHIEQTFGLALNGSESLANQFASVVNEAVDNLIEYAHGGWVAGLYYPQVGEIEISLINRRGGFGGQTPQQQLDRLLTVIEGTMERLHGGGHGIPALMDLAHQYLGTLRLSNGNASLYISADGSMTSVVDDTGIEIPGGRVTIVLQLLPSCPSTSPTAQSMVDIVRRIISRNHSS
jgi:anti-sigma regulatory factor (Ser/Thr protein kinase)